MALWAVEGFNVSLPDAYSNCETGNRSMHGVAFINSTFGYPNPNDVRNGITYGIKNEKTGVLISSSEHSYIF